MTSSDSGTQTHLFLGSTGYGLPIHDLVPEMVRVQPPAARGDILHLVQRAAGGPGVIILADGRFGDVLSVSHRELLCAMDLGWRLWGVASMGAIRAAELEAFGMRGWGQVFNYMLATMAPDDEVAVLHGPPPEYRPVTEALVDIRGYLTRLVDAGIISGQESIDIENSMKMLWFGDRTIGKFREVCRKVSGERVDREISGLIPMLTRQRTKGIDLTAFLERRAWLEGERDDTE